MQQREPFEPDEVRVSSPVRLQRVFQSKLVPWIKLPIAYLASLRTPRRLFLRTGAMVEKEKPAATEARPVKPSSALKAEGTQPKTSGGSVQPEPKLPEDAWRCFVTTTKGSKLLLFLKPSLDVKQIICKLQVAVASRNMPALFHTPTSCTVCLQLKLPSGTMHSAKSWAESNASTWPIAKARMEMASNSPMT